MADPAPDPDQFEEAVRAFRRKVPLTDREYRELDAAERKRAFYVAQRAEASVVQEVMDALERAIRDGTTIEDFRSQVGPQLADAWGGEDPPRLETMFRTNVMEAYNAGRDEIFTDEAVLEARPYWRFDAVGDSRISDICEELDGLVLPADDPFWNTHKPPLHPNCRSIITPLTAEEAAEEGISRARPNTAPAEGFGAAPERTPEKPDLDGFDPAIKSILRDRLE